jgi:hypothetical protein
MRSKTYKVSEGQIETLLHNIEKHKGFCDHFGMNTERIDMSVETNLEGTKFVFFVRIPGHVFENIQTASFEEVLLNDSSD